jgi:hypothetical protein
MHIYRLDQNFSFCLVISMINKLVFVAENTRNNLDLFRWKPLLFIVMLQ